MRARHAILSHGGGLSKGEGQEILAYIEALEMRLAVIATTTREPATHDLATTDIMVSARLQEVAVLRAAKNFITHRNDHLEDLYRNQLQVAVFHWKDRYAYYSAEANISAGPLGADKPTGG